MVSAQKVALTAQFYEWELLGRGWLSAQEPVDLEPEFTPFFGHCIRSIAPIDDGIRHTLLSSIASAFKAKKEIPLVNMPPPVSYAMFPFENDSELIALRLLIPRQFKKPVEETEQLLVMLSYCTSPMSFEIQGTKEKITLQFVCREGDARYVKSQLTTFFRDIPIIESDAEAEQLLIDDTPATTVDFGLREEFMRPVEQYKGNGIDPFTGLFSILEHLQTGEQVIYQVLFNGVLNHWKQSIIAAVSDGKGGAFFEDAPEMLSLAKEKVSSTFVFATIRLMAQAATLDESFSLLHKLNFALVANTRSQTNSLLPLSNSEYSFEQRVCDIEFRESHRAGMLLNVKELATFIHLPDQSLVSKKVAGEHRKTKAAPPITEGHVCILGSNTLDGIKKTVTISNEQRLKHTHIIGATGTGKSTLLLSLICQDIDQGNGIAVIDPHGDLIDAVLSHIPVARTSDVIIIDPSDSEFPVAFNILKAHSDIEKEVLSSDLVAAFKRLSTSWGDQMNSVFANAILAFLESTKGGTLADLRRFLIEKPYREEFLRTVNDPNISYYWHKEYPLLKTNSVGPILTRLDAFLRPRLIRNMVAQQKGIDFEQLLNKKKILLVKLSQGLIGTENSYLLGTFVVSKIHQAALARQATQQRNDFFVYIDEFQHFITPSMSHILSGTRKYHVGLILAHQDLQQVQKTDSDLLNTLLTNAGARICFRLGDADAKRLADGFSFFEPHDLQNLGRGESIARIERPDFDFSLTTMPYKVDVTNVASSDAVMQHSRNSYSTPKRHVEEILKESLKEFEVSSTNEMAKPEPSKSFQSTENKQQAFRSTDIPKTKPIPDSEKKEIKEVIQKKEEKQHRYLQSLIKKMAESKGYRATIEMPTPDSKGFIDVSIEGNNLRIACEVSVTTESTWELHNIEKCLAANYTHVFVCCAEKKVIGSLQTKVHEKFSEAVCNKIIIGEPEQLFDFLDQHSTKQAPTETKLKGYRVKVEYEAISHESMEKKRGAIAKVITDAMKKLKK